MSRYLQPEHERYLPAPAEQPMLHTRGEVLAVFDLHGQPVTTGAERAASVERCMGRDGEVQHAPHGGICTPDRARATRAMM